jgi:hypothetical protein
MIHIGKVDFGLFVLWSKVRRGGPVRRQARWQVEGAKPMIWRFMMLSCVHHHNIPGAWGKVFTALDNIEVLTVSQNKKSYPTTRVKYGTLSAWSNTAQFQNLNLKMAHTAHSACVCA